MIGGVLRRRAFSLPYPDLVPALAAAVRGESTSAGRDDRFAEATLHHQLAGFVLTAADEGRLQLQPRARTLLADRLAVATLRSGLLRRELGAALQMSVIPFENIAKLVQPSVPTAKGVAKLLTA